MKKQIRLGFPGLGIENELVIELGPETGANSGILFRFSEYGHLIIGYNVDKSYPIIRQDLSDIDPVNYKVNEVDLFPESDSYIPALSISASNDTAAVVLGGTTGCYFTASAMISYQREALMKLCRFKTAETKPACIVTGKC